MMKNNLKIFLLFLSLITIFNNCTDNEALNIAEAPSNGSYAISSSNQQVVLSETDADTQIALTLSWSLPSYNISTPVTYTLEMTTTDDDFSNAKTFSVSGTEISFTHADLNFHALDFNIAPDTAGELKFRLKTNLKYDNLTSYSTEVNVEVTPYNTLVLLYDMPSELYLQGNAVPSNWGTPVPESQRMTQIDDHRFGLIVELTGSANYAAISTPTTWSDPAYVGVNAGQSAFEGDFRPAGSMTVPAWGGSPMDSPPNTGVYKVIFDFTTGKYLVNEEPSLLTYPTDLYIIGDATPQGWAANVDASQKFTKINDYTFEITIPLTEGGGFAFITATSYSDPAYKAKTTSQENSGGDFIASGSATTPAWGGNDIVAPKSSVYTITVNFKSGTYILKG